MVALRDLILHPLTAGRGFLTERTLKAGSLLPATWLKAFKAIFSHVALVPFAALTVSSEIQVNWSWQMLALTLQLDLQVACRGVIFLNLWRNCVQVVKFIETSIQSWNWQKLLQLYDLKLRLDQKRKLEIHAFHCDQFSFVILFLDSMKRGGNGSNSEHWSQLVWGGMS